jgi:hypothetical protein
VIGEPQGRLAEGGRALGEGIDATGPVEDGVLGVDVEMGERRVRHRAADYTFGIGFQEGAAGCANPQSARCSTGALFHWVTQTDNGFRVTDVWESQEAFQAFAEEHIGPKSAEAGLSEPNPTFYEVHNHFIKN